MSSRKEQKEALRQERLAREQAAAQSAARKRLIGIVVAAVLVLGIVGALAAVLLAGGDDGGGGGSADDASIDFPDAREIPPQSDTLFADALRGSGCRLESPPLEEETDHRDGDIEYPTNPPASGPQNGVPAEDDFYEESPTEERVMHALEHGRIGIWVNPSAPEDTLAGIRALYDEDPYHVIVTPQPGLREEVALSAWEAEKSGRILRCPTVTDESWDAMRAFKEKYRDKAPEFTP